MEGRELLRIVQVRKGKIRPAEFRLREGETGLSLFEHVADPSPEEVVAAVSLAGKQGDLTAVAISEQTLRQLALHIVRTAGGTPVPAVNAVHCEARLSFWRRVVLALRGAHVPVYVT